MWLFLYSVCIRRNPLLYQVCMKGDDACILASQLDLLIDVRHTNHVLRCIRLLSSRPPPGDGAPLLGGVGKLPDVVRSVLTVF